MKTLTKEQVKEILRKHKIWLEDPDNEEAEQANLRGADLQGANLRGADLQGADLQRADLRGADLQGANLRGADLRWADLQRADLRWADLQRANLRGADLQGANLRGADLRGADLRWADLQGADLRGANYASMQCPEEGAFIAFKKCQGDKIIKLLIPEDAKRSSATSRKCRASKAVVLEITNFDGKIKYKEAESTYDSKFIYKQGQTLEIENFDDDRWNECSTGIHFFITRQEAVDY